MRDPFRPLSEREIRERIEIVRAAKAAKGFHGNLTRAELTRLLGPSIESSLEGLYGQRRNMAHVKCDNFGIIGVRKLAGNLPYVAYAHKGRTNYKGRFRSWREAVKARNEWASKLWPGCPEALCDWNAAKERWGRRGKRARKTESDS